MTFHQAIASQVLLPCSCILYMATNCNIVVFMTVCIYRYTHTTALYYYCGQFSATNAEVGHEMLHILINVSVSWLTSKVSWDFDFGLLWRWRYYDTSKRVEVSIRKVLQPATSAQIFLGFPCVYKRMLRWFPRLQVATVCFSCSTPELNFLDPYIICMLSSISYLCTSITNIATGWQLICSQICYIIYYKRR